MVRISVAATMLWLAAGTAGAAAASILDYRSDGPATTPSIVRVESRPASPSIMAAGVPPVSGEKVAAIGTAPKSSRRPAPMPMVIRGGAGSPAHTGAAPAVDEEDIGDARYDAPEQEHAAPPATAAIR